MTPLPPAIAQAIRIGDMTPQVKYEGLCTIAYVLNKDVHRDDHRFLMGHARSLALRYFYIKSRRANATHS